MVFSLAQIYLSRAASSVCALERAWFQEMRDVNKVLIRDRGSVFCMTEKSSIEVNIHSEVEMLSKFNIHFECLYSSYVYMLYVQ